MLQFLRRLFSWSRRIELDRPQRIAGDVMIRFRGSGRARFRLQHARDREGVPDDLSWCEVSALSNLRETPEDVIRRGGGVCSVLVDAVDGEASVLYRRHAADWIRVLPIDDQDGEARERCANYRITLQPVM